MKKITALLLCMVLLATIFVGCNQSGQTSSDGTTSTSAADSGSDTPAPAPSGEPSNITLVIYGDKNDRMSTFTAEEIPKYVADKGLNINVELQVLPWSDYATGQTELKLASGEEFACYTDIAFMSRSIGKGYIQDLTEVINQYGGNLLRELEQLSFDAFSSKGMYYGIPIGNKPNASEFFAVTVRQDLLEEAGMTELKTLEDVESFYTATLPNYPDYFGYCDGSPSDTYGAVRMMSRLVSDKNMLFLNELIFTDASADDDVIYSYFESEEFKEYAAIALRWNEMGIIDKQVISDAAIAGSKFMAGQGMFRNGNAGRTWEELLNIRNNVGDAKLKSYFIGDANGRPLVSRGTYSTAFQVSTNVKNPEAYVQFLNLIYEDQASFDFFTYGVKDVDYELDENERIINKKNDMVFLHEWATTHVDYMRFPDYVEDDVISDYKSWNDGCIPQKDIGFAFDLEPVKDIYAQLQNVSTEYLVPIALGFADYETAFPEAQKRLKDAGIDEYVAEYQRQFTEFYNNK